MKNNKLRPIASIREIDLNDMDNPEVFIQRGDWPPNIRINDIKKPV